MQRIERYGVIALILLLVTIAAVSFWEDAEENRALQPELETRRERVAEVEAANRSGPSSGSRHTLSGTERGIAGELPATAGNARRTRGDAARRSATPGASGTSNTRPGGTRPGGAAKPATTGFQALPSRQESNPQPFADPGWEGDESGRPYRGGAGVRERGQGAVPREPAREREEEDVPFPAALAATETPLAEPPRTEPPAPMHEVPRETPRETPRQSPTSGTYVVEAGDTLSQIAEKCLGSSKRWREIQSLNGGIDPSKVHVGLELRLPSASSVAAAAPASTRPATPRTSPSATPGSSSSTYVVRRGDMLSTIAQKELGSARRWPEIAALNPEIDPNRVIEGTRLRMPAGSSRATAAPPSSTGTRVASAPAKKNRVR